MWFNNKPVSLSLWNAFKQVWQQAASLLLSWCNHLNRSIHAVWNDLFVAFLLQKVFVIFRLAWTIWYVYKDLNWRAELCLCRFQFASYCCGWLQIIFISGLFFGSDCFFDYTRLCIPYLFSTPQARSQQQTELEETCPSKWHQRRVVFSRPYVGIFSTNVERTSFVA